MDEGAGKDRQIGQILLDERLIDESRLQIALSEQARQVKYRPIGEILRELGFISRNALQQALLKYRKRILIGELLVKMGLLSDMQLADALEEQKNSQKKLGQILVESGLINRSDLIDAICLQQGIEAVDLSPLVDKDLIDRVSVTFLRSHRVLPLKHDKERRTLKVLMEDPTDAAVIADLEKAYGMEIEPVMLRSDAMDHLFDGLLDIWYLSR